MVPRTRHKSMNLDADGSDSSEKSSSSSGHDKVAIDDEIDDYELPPRSRTFAGTLDHENLEDDDDMGKGADQVTLLEEDSQVDEAVGTLSAARQYHRSSSFSVSRPNKSGLRVNELEEDLLDDEDVMRQQQIEGFVQE